jgi:hypothetical protein
MTTDSDCRLVCSPTKSGFLKRPLNWVDIAAILPYYIEVQTPTHTQPCVQRYGCMHPP